MGPDVHGYSGSLLHHATILAHPVRASGKGRPGPALHRHNR